MSNTTPTPRTRRQLREALRDETLARLRAEEDAKGANERFNSLAEALKADGWTARYAPAGGFIVADFFTGRRSDPIVGWTPPDRAAGKKANEATTRRDTLATVIDALSIPGYAAGGYIPKGPTIHVADRFWSDLQTALSVREADKHAETQRKIAEKVAGLATRHPNIAEQISTNIKQAASKKPAAKKSNRGAA